MSFAELIQDLVNALQVGSIYALVALGVALIFGIMRLVNFAQGEFIMFAALVLSFVQDWPLVVKIAVALLASIVIAVASERIVFRSLRGSNPVVLLIASFALSIGLQSIALIIVGTNPRGAVLTPELNQSWDLGGVLVPKLAVATIVVTAILLALLVVFLNRHPIGVMMRAAAVDFTMARLVGIRADLVIAIAFAISGLLAGVAGLLLVAQTGIVTPDMGLSPLIFGFMAAVLGGLGSLHGAVIGGYLLGIAGTALQVFLPAGLTSYRDAFLFGVVLLVMLIRPQGLFIPSGAKERV